MKNSDNILFGFVVIGLMIACLACGGASYTKPGSEYFGVWRTADSTIAFNSDGSAVYAAPDMFIRNGEVRIYDRQDPSIILSVGEIQRRFKIEAPPAGDKLKLSGVEYERSGDTSLPVPGASVKVPSDGEIEAVVKALVADYAKALDSGDFDSFWANRGGDTVDIREIRERFDKQAGNKTQSLAALRDSENRNYRFDRNPDIGVTPSRGEFYVIGSFPTQPAAVRFEGYFEVRSGKWRSNNFTLSL